MPVSAESQLTGGLGYVSYEVKAYDKKAHGQNQRSSAESVGTQGIYEILWAEVSEVSVTFRSIALLKIPM